MITVGRMEGRDHVNGPKVAIGLDPIEFSSADIANGEIKPLLASTIVLMTVGI